jgi:hypothetical protein
MSNIWHNPENSLPERLTLVIGVYLDFPLLGDPKYAAICQSDHYFITYLEADPNDDRWYSHSFSGNSPVKPPDRWTPLSTFRPYVFERDAVKELSDN